MMHSLIASNDTESDMRVLVTGAIGFIGSHVCRELVRSGHQVTGLDSNSYAADPKRISDLDIEVHICDVCDQQDLDQIVESKKIEWIVHTAAETHVDNSIRSSKEFVRSNIEGTRSVLDVCRSRNIGLLHFSTDEVYGVPTGEAFTEDSPLNPRNPYSATKAAADLLVRSYEITHGYRSITIRPSNNFGPGQHDEKFIPTIIRSVLSGKKVPVYGDGMQEREWTSVKDTARAVAFLLKEPSLHLGQAYNLSSGFSIPNIEVVKRTISCIRPDDNPDSHISYVKDRPGHDRKYWISSQKIADAGFRFKDNFDDILSEACRCRQSS